jgi:iron complex transport system substrate-binding protein
MQYRIVVVFLSLLCICSCRSGPGHSKATGKAENNKLIIHAAGFTIQPFGSGVKLNVIDPWQKSTNNVFEYFLIKNGETVPADLAGKQIFHVPVKNAVCLSTTHIGFLDALGELSSVSGLSGTAYLTNAEVKKGVAENRIREVGNEQGLNYEVIVQLKPDVVFAYGIGSEINAQINKLRDLGIPVVLVGEYLEKSPLDKAEWIKFFGAFFNKEQMADSIFERIRINYEKIKSDVSNEQVKPTVLTGLPFKDTWWIAGGQSNLAVLIEDAGGKFLWSGNHSSEAFPVSLEEVFLRSAKADFWINSGSVNSLKELLSFDQRFSEIPAVKRSQVYNNNLRSTTGGGNDYWESGVVHPDLILSDLVKIFHPERGTDKRLFYYQKLN